MGSSGRVYNPNGISVGSAVSAGLTTVTNRVTDHASRSVTIGRTYVRGTAIRPENERCPRLIRVTM